MHDPEAGVPTNKPIRWSTRMASLRKFAQFIIGVVVVGILVNFLSEYLGKYFPRAGNLAVQLAAVAAAMWALVLVTKFSLAYFTSGRYAVEALILNAKGDLLMYRHPHHKCMLPPGGRVKRTEFPHVALQNRLRERLGLTGDHYEFNRRIHFGLDDSSVYLGDIQRVPAPFLVQSELHKQRTFVRLHYDFIYVVQLTNGQDYFDAPKYAPVRFVNESALRQMVEQRHTLPDVLDAYLLATNAIARAVA